MERTHRRPRWAIRTLVSITTMAVGLALPPAGWAHSVLIATDPVNDAIVTESPKQIVLRFDEPVETALGSIRVFNGSGERVDGDEVQRPLPEVVVAPIEGELERGTYTVTWRVISADSDPISGAFVFHMGERGAQPGGIADEVEQSTSGIVDFLFTPVRFLDYALLLLCTGGAIILAFVVSMAAAPVRRKLYLAVSGLALALVVIALVGLVLQGAKAGGTGLRDALGWDVLSAVSGTRFGEMALLRAGLAGALAVAAFVLARRGASRVGAVLCIVLGALMLVTPAASGHASVSGKLSVTADYAHMLAAAAWTGGLAFLLAALLLARSDRWSLASRSVPRFSNLAVVAVGVLVTAGAVNGYLQVRTWQGLWDTEYGVLLMAKIALVIPLLGLGALNNRYAVPRLKSNTASEGERRRFLRTVGAELAVMTVIVGVTAVLVNAAPAAKAEAHGASSGGAVTVELGPYQAEVTVSPGTPGPNQITFLFQHTGQPDEVIVLATLASEGIGPLRYVAANPVHGTFVVRDAQLTIAGDWELRVEARKGEFEQYTVKTTTTIGH